MTQNFSLSLSNSLLNYIFDAVAMPAAPASVHLSLHTADPNRVGANEVADAGYARINVSTLFTPDADDTVIANSTDIVFGAAVGSFTSTHWGLWRVGVGSVDTDFICQGQWEVPLVVLAAGVITVPAGDLQIGIL